MMGFVGKNLIVVDDLVSGLNWKSELRDNPQPKYLRRNFQAWDAHLNSEKSGK